MSDAKICIVACKIPDIGENDWQKNRTFVVILNRHRMQWAQGDKHRRTPCTMSTAISKYGHNQPAKKQRIHSVFV